MATSKRKFFFYTVESDEAPLEGRLLRLNDLGDPERVYIHDDQQVLFRLERQGDLLAGYVTILRQDNVPTIGRRDSLASRQIDLGAEEGILEASHFVYYPEKRLLAFEYNHFGPKVNLFFAAIDGVYRDHFAEDATELVWAYALRGDAFERLEHAGGVKSVTVRVAKLSLGSHTGGFGATLNELAEVGDWATAEIILRPPRQKNATLMRPLDFIAKLLPRGGQSLADYEKCKVTVLSPTGGVEEIDLFKDKIVSQIYAQHVGRTRLVSRVDLFNKIEEDIRRRARSLAIK